MKKTALIIYALFLIHGCATFKAQNNHSKVLYFAYMKDISHQGKMIFRTRLQKKDLDLYKQKSYEKYYYKVYHNGLPQKVEELNLKNNKVHKIYFFNKEAIMTKTIEYKNNQTTTCYYNYLRNQIRQICDNINQIYFFRNGDLIREKIYINNELNQTKIIQNGYILSYDKNYKLIKKENYEDAGYTLPVENDFLEKYPFRTQ